jgi:alpha-D-xyloside xylohydrolase
MSGFRRDGDKLIFERSNEIIQIEAWGVDSLRVRTTANRVIRDDLPGALLPPKPSEIQIEILETHASIQNGAILAELSPAGNHREDRMSIRFSNAGSGAEILAEPPAHFRRYLPRSYRPAGGDHYKIEQRFKAYEGEKIYGLGQHQHGLLDQKGSVIDLFQINTEVCIPFLLSNRGYGFLWHNPAVGRVELGATQTRWVAESSQQIDYWITLADTPAEILSNYADATGHAPLLPEWAAGFWQCKLRYRTQEELLQVARQYKQRGLPLDVIVVDYFHWSAQGDWQFDPECWPDPPAMMRELEDMGIKVMVSIWPTVNPLSKNYPEMRKQGLLVRSESGIPAQMDFVDVGQDGPTFVAYYDPTNPAARQFIWEQVRKGYHQHGVKVWWLDACEPEIFPRHPENLRYHLGNGLAVTNIYPLLHARAFYEGMQTEGESEIISLCRSAWAGSQRYGAALWSGDVQSSFEEFRAQITAGLNAAISGIPWWTTDIGGFFNGDIHDPLFQELIVRWFQYGLFCPLFRLHGNRLPGNGSGASWSGGPNEIWSFGEEAYEIIKELLFLRERLKPYIMEQMKGAHENGTPPMRPLFFDFPEDPQTWDIDDQFMFGPDYLVAPVLEYGARSRKVYLPAGITWRDAWRGEVHQGNQWLNVAAPLEQIPVFLRAYAELPIR